MTIRPEVGRVWASAASTSNVQDPDKYTPGKVNLGWVSEIPPYQWFNWLLKRNDELKRSLVERGIAAWGSDVTYLKGALAYNDADFTIYICLKENKGIQPDKDNGTNWVASAVQITKDDFTRLTQILSDHVTNKNNPHNVTAAQIDAYTKAQIDALLNKYNGDFNKHLQDFNNPHKTTAAAAGAVPITGGKYTGVVEFTQARMVIGSTTSGFDTSDNYTRIFKDDKGLGINAAGKPVFSTGSSQKELLYSENFASLTLQNNPTFAVPSPDLHIPLSGDICIYEGEDFTAFSRASRASYINLQGVPAMAELEEPRFEREGLLLEKESTNLVPYSNPTKDNFSCGQGAGVIENDTPWGILNMTKFNTSNTWISFDGTELPLSQSQGKTLCGSFFIRKRSSDESMKIYLSAATDYVTVYFDESRNKGNAHVKKISSNMYRVWLTHYFAPTETRPARLYCMCGTGDALGGKQIEEALEPTSWIPTTSSSAKREREYFTLPVVSMNKSLGYTLSVELSGSVTNRTSALTFSDGVANMHLYNYEGKLEFRNFGKQQNTGINFATVNGQTFTLMGQASTSSLYVDGVQQLNGYGMTDASAPVLSAVFYGLGVLHFRNFRFWNQALTPEQISTL